MFPSSAAVVLRNVLRILVPASVALTVYLYLYPVFHTCAFPLPDDGGHRPNNGGGGGGSGSRGDTSWRAFVETAKLHSPFGASASPAGAAEPGMAPFRLLALGDPQLEGDTSIPNARGASFLHLSSTVDHATFRSAHGSLRERVC